MVQTQINAKFISLDRCIIQRLRELRDKRGISVSELAKRANMDDGALGKVLRGNRGLRADELFCLCYVLDVNVEDVCPRSMLCKLAEAGLLPVKAHCRK